jgi:predicted transposase YbfD/YdcC
MLRGANRNDRQVHLLACRDHATVRCLPSVRSTAPLGEVPAFQPLLAGLDPTSAAVTAAALHTHPAAAEVLATSKQPTTCWSSRPREPSLLDRCAGLPWHDVPVLDRTRDQAHGRVELRTLKTVTVGGFAFPHAAQVVQVIRKTRDLACPAAVQDRGPLRGHQPHLRPGQPHPPCRPHPGHWAIENGLHDVRDVTFAEDASRLRTGNGPQVMACLRDLVIGALSRAGPVNLAAALRSGSHDEAMRRTLGIDSRCAFVPVNGV